MPRPKRVTIPGAIHHVIHRGNNRQAVFFDESDFELYLSLLTKYSTRYGFQLLSYCLMSNHVHLVGIPENQRTIQNLVRDTHSRYSCMLNEKMGRCGHTWQDRHDSIPCDDFHGIASMCYSEMNPVRAGMVKNAWDYRWSSARSHTGIEKAGEFLDMSWWSTHFCSADWKEVLIMRSEIQIVDKIRRYTSRGKPLGNFH